jgi:replication-associated recombination protein RarA
MEKQVNLDGEPIEPDEENPDVSVLKSALQKAIRRGMVEKAMSFSLLLLEKAGSWITWKRLSTIADEDVGQPEVILAVDCLYRKFHAMKPKDGNVTWDMKRCVVLAARILAEAKKDRRADEFLELWDAMEKMKDVEALQNLKELWTAVPDEAYDVHTAEGRMMGRGNEYWYRVSSRCENMTLEYAKWREWWEDFMVVLVKRKKATREGVGVGDYAQQDDVAKVTKEEKEEECGE